MLKAYLVWALLLSVALGAVPQNRVEEDEETTANSDVSNMSEGTSVLTEVSEGSETGSSDVSEGSESTIASSDVSEGSETGSSDVSEGSESTVASSDVSEGSETGSSDVSEGSESTVASSDVSEGSETGSSIVSEGSETGSSGVSEGSETTIASSDASQDSETGSSNVSEGSETTASSNGTCMCECPCGGETTISVTSATPEVTTTTKAPTTTTTQKPTTAAPCITISGAQTGVPCVFPFKARGKTYTQCTHDGGYATAWCATGTDGDDNIILGRWGECKTPQEDPNCYPEPTVPETTTASPGEDDDHTHHWVAPVLPKDEGLCLESDIVFNICAKNTEIGMKFKEAQQKCSSSVAKSGGGSKESGSKSKGSKESGGKSKGSKESKESGGKSKGSKESKESGSKSKGSKESKESGSKSKGSKESKESKGSSSSSSSESEEGCDDEFDKILEVFEAAWEMKSCVFKEMGWVNDQMEVNLDAIKEDLDTLPDFVNNGMEGTLDMCSKKAENATIENIFGNDDFDLKLSSKEAESRKGSKESGSKSKGSKESKESGGKSKGSKESGSKSKGSKESGESSSSSSESGASSSIEDCVPQFDEDQINKIEEIMQKLVFFHCIHDSFLDMCGKYLIGLISKDIKPPAPPCITVSGAQAGAKCTFPFVTRGMEYHTCTFDGGYETPWCATKVDKDGTIVFGNWGECPKPEEDPNCYPFPAFPETTTAPPNNNGGCGCDFEFTSISMSIHISFTIIAGQKFNGFPCYLGLDGSFMYVSSEGYWVVGTKLGVSTTVFMKYTISKATITIPTISWMYFQSGSWIQVSDLYSIPQKDFDVSFNSSISSIHVSFQMMSGGFKFNGFPCYIGSDGSFMYVSSEGYWVCGGKLGDSASVYMKNMVAKATVTLPSMSWMYRVDGGAWLEDSGLNSLPQSGFDVSFSSSTIHVSFVKTVTMYNGFPVYIGHDGSFMYVNSEQMWVVGAKLGDSASVWMRNPETPATSTLPILDWTYRVDGGEWIIDSGLVSIPQKGQDLEFKSSSLSIEVSFTKITKMYNGFPVYIGSDGSFLYVSSDNVWVVGTKLGDASTCWMKNTEVATATIPTMSWTYHVYGSPWVAVPDLVSIPQKGQDLVFSSISTSIHISYTKISTQYNGFPTYIGSDGSFMWVSSQGTWVAGTTMGDETTCFIKNNAPATDIIPSMSWWHRVVGEQWTEVADLYSLPQKGFTVEFTSTGAAATAFSFPIGFKVLTIKHQGVSVLIGSEGSFMFMVDGFWMIGPVIGDISSVWMKNSPSGWMYKESGEWKADASIAFTGEPPKGECITIAGGAQVGVPCLSPFTARGKTYTKPCTFEGGYSTPWCPTKLNLDGSIVLGNWGECPMDDSKCPNDKDEQK